MHDMQHHATAHRALQELYRLGQHIISSRTTSAQKTTPPPPAMPPPPVNTSGVIGRSCNVGVIGSRPSAGVIGRVVAQSNGRPATPDTPISPISVGGSGDGADRPNAWAMEMPGASAGYVLTGREDSSLGTSPTLGSILRRL